MTGLKVFTTFILLITTCLAKISDSVDPEIANGHAKSGIRFRINPRGFSYANELIAPLLSQQIRNIKIPKIEQCIDELDGCISISKIMVSKYECPDSINVRPNAPNEVLIEIKNLDLGVSGDLEGNLNVSQTKVPVTGTANAEARGARIVVGISLGRSKNKEHVMRLTRCEASMETVDINVVNGGEFGDSLNDSRMKSKIAAQIKRLAPEKVCAYLPEYFERDINKHLKQLPSSVSISEIIQMFKDMVLPLLRSKFQCPEACATPEAKHKRDLANVCKECGKISEAVELGKSFCKSLDFKKLDNIAFDYSILYTKASDKDLIINLKGEFAPPGQSTPFKPYATKFPVKYDRMAEALFTDFTLNSLLYWLHEVRFLNITLDHETPTVGEILKTTCGDDDENGEFPSVEVDEEVPVISRRRRAAPSILRRFRRDGNEASGEAPEEDSESGGGLADLGICFGDILPKIREEHPNENLSVQVYTTKAPAVIFGGADGGSGTARLNAEAAIFVASTGEKVGRVGIVAEIFVQIETNDGNLTGNANITQLKLTDLEDTLGLPQDALDSLSQLAIDFSTKGMNDALAKGVNVHLPGAATGLPISLLKPDFQFLHHALHIDGDIEVDAKSFGEIVGKKGIRADTCKPHN